MGDPDFGDERIYRWKPTSRFESRVIELDRSEGMICMENTAPDFLKYALHLLIAALVLGVVGQKQLVIDAGTGASLLLFFGFRHLVDVPRHEDYVITSIAISKYYFASILLAGIFAVFSSFSTSGTLQIVYIVGGLLILGEHFAQGSLPIDSDYIPDPGSSQSFLHVPVLGLAAPLGSYALINLFNLLRTSALPYWSVVSLTAVFAVLGTRGYGMACRDALDRVRLDRNAFFPSKPIRAVAALLYICVNVLSLAMLVFWVDLLALGISGGGLIQDFTPRGIELFTQIYANLDAVFQPLPLLSPRSYSLLFASLIFLPTLLLVGTWLAFLVLNMHLKMNLIVKGRPESFSEIDGSNISVISVDVGRPIIKPLSLFFGLKKCIVVDKSVLDFLDEDRDETQAVLAHEVYHLRNREVLVNILSSIFSLVVFGGKNALLAFYDYPRIEEEADRYAAEMFGAESLQSALRKIEYLQVQATGDSRIEQILGMPGFTGSRTRADEENADDPQEEAPLLQRVLTDFSAPYNLFYGTVLFDQAHRSVDERIQRLADMTS
ncbi:M48 family metalloprotease [Haloplanus aerogenes]|nr:M48 family metalloprotease [Haloplanus aerogenes]AZH26689.1 hypothetical protein DU502_15470 [Haloplanus aerogenes]